MSPRHAVVIGLVVFWTFLSGCTEPGVPQGSDLPAITGPSLAPSAGSVQYSAARLPTLTPGLPSEAYDINDAGVIVGMSKDDLDGERAVRWNGRTITDLDIGGYTTFPPDTTRFLVESVAYGISPTGVVVGAMVAGGGRGAFRLNVGGGLDTLRGLDTIYGISVFPTEAVAVNGKGTAVGYSTTTGNSANVTHAARWGPSGTFVDLQPSWALSSVATDINEGGWISGYAVPKGGFSGGGGVAGSPVAVLWSPDDPPSTMVGALYQKSAGFGLDDKARMVGAEYHQVADLHTDGFANLWPAAPSGGAIALHPCGGAAQTGEPPVSVAVEISNLGRIVGWCNTKFAPQIPPVRGWTVRLVNGVPGSYQFLPVIDKGLTFTRARSVNACGTVVGSVVLWNGGIGTEAMTWTRINTAGTSNAPVCDR